MESITIEGTKYVKASSLARDFGYTTDYVGQLCRANKVEAQLVGRSWFVNPTTLKDHKQTRYRSTLTKTKEAVEDVKLRIVASDAKKVPKYPENFYERAKSDNSTIRYEKDSADLLPELAPDKKHKELPVELADAEKVSVEVAEEAYQVETPKREKPQFMGAVSVREVEDELPTEEVEEAVKPETVPVRTPKPEVKIKVPSAPETPTPTAPKEPNPSSNSVPARPATMSTIKKVSTDESADSVSIPIEVTSYEEQKSGRYLFVSLTSAFLLSVVTLSAAFFLESTTVATAEGVVSGVSIKPTYLEAIAFISR